MNSDPTAAELLERRIAELDDWRGATLSRLRSLMREAEPAIVEEVKWRKPTNPLGVAAWECDGLICTGETYRDKVKLTFAHGAALADPSGLFNASLTAGTRRAIDIHEGEQTDEQALKTLVRAAIAFNREKKARKGKV